MKAILVRIGVDQAYGEWNAPVDPATSEFVYVPIPDDTKATKKYTPGNRRRYDEIVAPLTGFATRHRLTLAELRCPEELLQRDMHLDPDFAHLTYGDNGEERGAGIAGLGPDDLVAFYAGLRSIAPPRKLLYALVGLLVVEKVVRARDVPPKLRHENAHTRWTRISDNDVVVRGKPGVSGRFDRCVPIGEFRDNAYRVSRQVEASWGGLGVKDGFIQRSIVTPALLDAGKFYRWFLKQRVKLLQRNS